MVTPEQFTAIIVALTGLLGAVGILIVQVRQLHTLTNSRMSELLDVTSRSSKAEGKLEAKAEEGAPPSPSVNS